MRACNGCGGRVEVDRLRMGRYRCVQCRRVMTSGGYRWQEEPEAPGTGQAQEE